MNVAFAANFVFVVWWPDHKIITFCGELLPFSVTRIMNLFAAFVASTSFAICLRRQKLVFLNNHMADTRILICSPSLPSQLSDVLHVLKHMRLCWLLHAT